MSNRIKLVPVSELQGKKFIVSSYQRGYKWKEKQVEDLLDDLNEFKPGEGNEFYCLQPLVVKGRRLRMPESISIGNTDSEEEVCLRVKEAFGNNVQWEVIDGQQRLTTIFLLLCYLKGEAPYSLSYETRDGSEDYLKSFESTTPKKKYDNVDYYHINLIYDRIKKWFEEDNKNIKPEEFARKINEQSQFIWYETNEDSIKVFTRLNIGKISLTNSELIKALLLSRSGSSKMDDYRQNEIANRWNLIEQTLQNDEFWYFVHGPVYDKPTRIDYLFDILCDIDCAHLKEEDKNKYQERLKKIGTDQFRTFRHYDIEFKDSEEASDKKWKEICDLFAAMKEWYNDNEFYHYIGFLVCCKNDKDSIKEYYKIWSGNKEKKSFLDDLKKEIIKVLKKCNKSGSEIKDLLDQKYEEDSEKGIQKTECKPVLLLHNVQTVINQNKRGESDDVFNYKVINRFPFYLYKNEEWDVEHIDSNSTNDLKDNYTRLLWLLQYKLILPEGKYPPGYKRLYDSIINYLTDGITKTEISEKEIKMKMKDFVFNSKGVDLFELVANEIKEVRKENVVCKNKLGNYTLLDASTNRGYGNSIFPSKRRTIMAKDRGMSIQLMLVKKNNGSWEFEDKEIVDRTIDAFIPPVTKNVFMKYYTPLADSFEKWDQKDFDDYVKDIRIVLSDFLPNMED